MDPCCTNSSYHNQTLDKFLLASRDLLYQLIYHLSIISYLKHWWPYVKSRLYVVIFLEDIIWLMKVIHSYYEKKQLVASYRVYLKTKEIRFCLSSTEINIIMNP